MIKKVIILALIILFISNAAFAVRAVTRAEHEAYLKGLGLNQTQITKLEEIDRKSREFRRQNPTLTKKDFDRYHSNLIYEVEKSYKKDLNKVLNPWQKKRYLEYKSRVY